ncbi:MAG: hypothetical protein WCF57_09305, partial [Pyrinomonadaceae bacterium]
MKSLKYKIRRPSRRIVERFEQTLAVCCELYNAALQERRDAWKLNCVTVNYHIQRAQLPEIKSDREDVAAAYAQVLQD